MTHLAKMTVHHLCSVGCPLLQFPSAGASVIILSLVGFLRTGARAPHRRRVRWRRGGGADRWIYVRGPAAVGRASHAAPCAAIRRTCVRRRQAASVARPHGRCVSVYSCVDYHSIRARWVTLIDFRISHQTDPDIFALQLFAYACALMCVAVYGLILLCHVPRHRFTLKCTGCGCVGLLCAGGSDGVVRVWDVHSGGLPIAAIDVTQASQGSTGVAEQRVTVALVRRQWGCTRIGGVLAAHEGGTLRFFPLRN